MGDANEFIIRLFFIFLARGILVDLYFGECGERATDCA
jgi:hypothetical protein